MTFNNVTETPLLSINRDFSAPITMTAERAPHELERLAQADTDPFSRYEAMQELMMCALIAGPNGDDVDTQPVIRAVGATLQSNSLDAAFKAEAILLPSESVIADRLDWSIRTRSTRRARPYVKRSRRHWATNCSPRTAAMEPQAMTCRRPPRFFAGCAPFPLGCWPLPTKPRRRHLAKAQFDAADNMTDRQGGLGVLVSLDAPERQAALDAFTSGSMTTRWCSTNGSRFRRRRSVATPSTRC